MGNRMIVEVRVENKSEMNQDCYYFFVAGNQKNEFDCLKMKKESNDSQQVTSSLVMMKKSVKLFDDFDYSSKCLEV